MIQGSTVGVAQCKVDSIVASQLEDSWLKPREEEPLCSEPARTPQCQHGFSMGVPASSHSPKTCRLISNSKLAIGVNVSVNGCLSLCVGPVIVWGPVRGEPRLSPIVSWDRLQPLCDRQQDKQWWKINEWIWFIKNNQMFKVCWTKCWVWVS